MVVKPGRQTRGVFVHFDTHFIFVSVRDVRYDTHKGVLLSNKGRQ